MTQTTFKVSPAFVLKAHSVACSEWKGKLEREYPSVFKSAQTFKQGDKVQLVETSFSKVTYIVANFGSNKVMLVNMVDGNRWADAVTVANPTQITIKEMAEICASVPLETILVNGTTPSLKPNTSTRKTLEATKEMILEAYKATGDGKIHKMIKDEFPEAFGGYVRLVEGRNTEGESLTLSTHNTEVDGVDFMIAYGLAPRKELQFSCITVESNEVEVEVIHKDGRTFVAFKKK